MTGEPKDKSEVSEPKGRQSIPPLIFISHDSRDAELAEAFSKLLRSVSAGMLKSFRSSDKKGTEGIEFGDEWYKRLMGKLESASDVVALLTEKSIERPWILYEAGVAKGKMETPVFGVALGVPLSRVSIGPFYQFQNCDDSEESLTKLVMQLARRISALEPDPDVVKSQVQAFKAECEKIFSKLKGPSSKEQEETPSEASTAKLLEEVKVIIRDLPLRFEKRFVRFTDPERRLRIPKLYPLVVNELMHICPNGPENPLSILLLCSMFRDDAPWLYELGREAYETAIKPISKRRKNAFIALRHAIEMTMRGPLSEMLHMEDKGTHMAYREILRYLEKITEIFLHGDESNLWGKEVQVRK